MSAYFIKGKGWRYDFTHKGTRHTEAWFETKRAARLAEAEKREELENPVIEVPEEQNQIDMSFFDLVTLRLDHVKAYNSESHYISYKYLARSWVREWKNLMCAEITRKMVQKRHFMRREISAYTANQDLRYLRATFNFGVSEKLIVANPTEGIKFFPVEKRVKYVPPITDIEKVIAVADQDTQDYLIVIMETVGRVSEINRLEWDDVYLNDKSLVLYTRKKKGGHLTPRKIPMTDALFRVLSRRYQNRDPEKKWVFWHRYWSRKQNRFCIGPYKDRKKFMKTLCKKAGVRYFRFHPLRHFGASIMDSDNVPIGSIQRILGHENRKTTEIYLHSIGDAERNAMDVYERARQKSHTESHT